jgi:hypothetical protein
VTDLAKLGRRRERWIAAAVLVAAAAAAGAAAAPSMSAIVFGLPISFEHCRGRVASALATEGYADSRDFGNGWLATTSTHSAAVSCIEGDGETVISLVVASEGDTVTSRDRLVALLKAGQELTESAHLGVTVSPEGEVVAHWKDTPGNAQDWVAVRPVGSPDDSYGEAWAYTEGRRSGSKHFGRLPPGSYEVRLFHDWPRGAYAVQERLRFRVGG